MTESPYSFIDRCMETLNLDFSSGCSAAAY